MRKYLLALAMLGLTACINCGPSMDICRFSEIGIGDCIDDVVRCSGRPYEIRCCNNGKKLYVYMSRDEMAPGVTRYVTYTLVVQDGVVVDKCIDQEETCPMFSECERR